MHAPRANYYCISIALLSGLLLSGCEGVSSDGSDIADSTGEDLVAQMSGSIGDGPVLGATIVIRNRKGNVIRSEDMASTNYNITLQVRGGKKSTLSPLPHKEELTSFQTPSPISRCHRLR